MATPKIGELRLRHGSLALIFLEAASTLAEEQPSRACRCGLNRWISPVTAGRDGRRQNRSFRCRRGDQGGTSFGSALINREANSNSRPPDCSASFAVTRSQTV